MQALTSRLRSFFFLFAFFLPCAFSQNKGSIGLHTAKFITGDDPSRSQPGISDTGWKDSLRIYLAHVNDVDETWLNGAEIGKTGMFPADPGGYVSKWPAVREYHLASNDPRIKWNQENIIAVRVYDGGGSGGIFMGNPYIDMLGKMDGVSFDSPEEGIRYLPGNKAEKSLHISNRFNIPIEGTLSYTVYDAVAGKALEDKSSPVKLSPFAGQDLTVRMPQRMGIEVTISFTEKGSGEKRTVRQVLPYLLTPPIADKPQINGPKLFGVRPGSPFFFRIPATGKGPLTYAVKDLPAGLTINAGSGIIQGVLTTEGEYKMVLIAKNALGSGERPFTIRVGNLLALTPPMGWNSWNCWGLSVSDEKVKSSAHALMDKGLTGHGWMYMNIDDGWESPKRAADSSIVPNEKFPDMKALGDFLHSNGIRFGIYSSPGPMTCGGFLGSYKNEEKDAESYAKWGIDYLKYDLCSYTELMPRRNSTLEQNQRPYILMRDLLKKQPRDIVYSLCQYGWQDVWKWGPEMNGNLWRTTGDIEDNWNSLYRIGFNQGRLSDYAQPGHWNDPDMLIVGRVGWGENLHPTRLTPYEQYTHMSLWSLLSAPLLLGCDLSKLDAFTLNLLTNDEVIALDQDPLGKQARQVIKKDSMQVWVKELEDGTEAVGIFNLQSDFHPITLKWEEIGLQGRIRVRDCWEQKDLGIKEDAYTVTVAPHGVSLIKISGFGKVFGFGSGKISGSGQ